MENASKALIMAAGVLVGILILSLAVFLFLDFGNSSSQIYDKVEANQLTQYNAQYTIYSGRTDVSIYEIISLANLAKENNTFYGEYSDFEDSYKVEVILQNNTQDQDYIAGHYRDLIDEYTDINADTGKLEYTFKCKGDNNIEYHSNGKVKKIVFTNNTTP